MGSARTLRVVFLSPALAAHVIFDPTSVSVCVSTELVTEFAEHDETHSAHLDTCARHGINRANAARASFCGLDDRKKQCPKPGSLLIIMGFFTHFAMMENRSTRAIYF